MIITYRKTNRNNTNEREALSGALTEPATAPHAAFRTLIGEPQWSGHGLNYFLLSPVHNRISLYSKRTSGVCMVSGP